MSSDAGALRNPISTIFLITFLICTLAYQVIHAFVIVDHYNLTYDVPRFPHPEGRASIGQDFAISWYGARNLIDNDRLFQMGASKSFNPSTDIFNHPPLIALLYVPLASYDPELAYRYFIVLMMLSWGIILYSLKQLFSITGRDVALFLCMLLLSCPFHFELERGNYHSFVVATMLLSFTALFLYKDYKTAGLFAACSTLLKVYPIVIPILLLCTGEITFFFWFCLSLVLFGVLSGGLDVYKTFLDLIIGYNFGNEYGTPTNSSTTSAMLMLFGSERGPEAITIAKIINGILIIVVSGMAVWTYIRKPRRESVFAVLAMGWIVSRVVPSFAYLYGLVFLPFVILVIRDMLCALAEYKPQWEKVSHGLAIFFGILCSYLLLPILGGFQRPGRFDLIWSKIPNLGLMQNMWFGLMVLFVSIGMMWISLQKFEFTWPLINSRQATVAATTSKQGALKLRFLAAILIAYTIYCRVAVGPIIP